MNTTHQALHQAIIDGVFPAAELLVAKDGNLLFHEWAGGAREGSIFDIASLTKPVCTATLTLMLIAEGIIKPTDTISQWLSGAKLPVHREITVQHLLHHTSGLPAWQPYYRELPLSMIGTEEGKNVILQEIFHELPEGKLGETVYSDLGYILLGKILEEAGDASLDQLFTTRISRPLNLKDTFFRPMIGEVPKNNEFGKKERHRRFAPTQDCPWRHRIVKGEVDDQNAFALGGIAGHAGLFSIGEDLHTFLIEFVKCSHGTGNLIPGKTMQAFFDFSKVPEYRVGEIFLGGWNLPSLQNSASGHHFSRRSMGHLAFTGCSIWIDLEKNAWIILLSNRVHPSNMNEKIKAFRPQIHDIAMKEFVI
ncbi:MAG: beta-lactamase family protein [Deltaproteobacteria bacterium]|nr:beta-lactamase family protein [Deltaproteobacteria bacterium]